MEDMQADQAEAQLRAGVYARLSETYDAAESVPTQLERGTGHATRRGWAVTATFKDDGFSGFKEITRDGFGELIAAIQAGAVDVVIVGDIDRLTRNLTDWNAFEKACVRHGVRLSAYTGGDLDLSTAEGAYYGGMETLRARRESAVKSARVREAQAREARKGRRTGGGQRWFGYTRIYANPDEPNHKKRHIVREVIKPVEAEAIRDAAVRVLEHGEIGRVDRAGLDRAEDQAGRGEAMVADLDCRHADLGAAGRAAGVAGPEVPDYAVAGDHRRGHP
jgi:DNA invertase Pin-like site-specific DNA recombinase